MKNEVGPISMMLHLSNTALWRAIGNSMHDLTSLRFESQTSRSRDKRVASLPIGQFNRSSVCLSNQHFNCLGNCIQDCRQRLNLVCNQIVIKVTRNMHVFSIIKKIQAQLYTNLMICVISVYGKNGWWPKLKLRENSPS